MTSEYLMPNYQPLPVAFEYGQGVWLYDKHKVQYLDALAGIAVCSLGHAHPSITSVLHEQASRIIHSSNLYEIRNQQLLGKRLAEISGSDAVFFCNSGAEANEAAIKLARLYAHNEKNHQEPQIVVMNNAFHGRTIATWSASRVGQSSPFAPLLPGFISAEFGNIESLKAAVEHPQCCAVMCEPIQGEGGVQVPPKGYLQAVRELCDRKGLLMIVDEVQTGIARTGRWYAYQHEGIVPDIITSAKALGNGVPIGACIAKKDIAAHLTYGTHGSTFGGNPLACAVGLRVLDVIEHDGLVEHSQKIGQYLMDKLKSELTHPAVKAVRGKGLMIGIEMDIDCRDLPHIALQNKLLINVTIHRVIRLLPPLILKESEADILVTCLKKSIQALEERS